MMYDSSDMNRDIIFCHFGLFLLFYPPNNLENQNFETKTPRYIILHMCNINQNHNNVWLLRYKVPQTQLFVTLSHFLPFYNTTNPENQNLEKMIKSLEISSFYTSLYTSIPKITIICYTLPEIRHFTDCYFSFWAIFF